MKVSLDSLDEEIKKEFSDATHNITVYIIGKTGEAGHYSV